MSLKAAVIGVGAMGRHHARVYRELDGVELVGVADPSAENAAFVARRYGVPTFADHREMLAATRPDLVSIVVPTKLHLEVAGDAIAAGAGVLVEKPIAATEDEGRALIAMAREAGVVLTVGHIERFNPAIRALKQKLVDGALGRIFSVRARRTGPFPARVRDVGVVVDLATHDLDIMRWLVGSPVTRIHAETAQRIHTNHEDLVAGLLRFESGEIGLLDINWLTPTKVRELSVTGERGMFVANYLSQELTFFENVAADSHWERYGELQGVGEGNMTRLAIARREPLAAELDAFAAAVRGEAPPVVSGEEGLAALALARAVVRAGREGTIVRPEAGLFGPATEAAPEAPETGSGSTLGSPA
jgi:predicted dehydrogenase